MKIRDWQFCSANEVRKNIQAVTLNTLKTILFANDPVGTEAQRERVVGVMTLLSAIEEDIDLWEADDELKKANQDGK